MPPLNLTAVKIVSNNGSTTINAETPTPFQFEFDRELNPMESVYIRCHMYEPVFEIDYYTPDITINVPTNTPSANAQAPQATPNKKYTASLKFPEELAGAKILMNFYLKAGANDLSDYSMHGSTQPRASGAAVDPISKAIRIQRKGAAAPKIEAVYWGEDGGIEYGKRSTARAGTIHKNEIGYLHIHTRGLYGKTIKGQFPPFGEQDYKVKNNTCVSVFYVSGNMTSLNSQLTGRAKVAGTSAYLPANTATLNLDKINDGPIVPVTTAVIASTGRDIMPPLGSSSQCKVELRPDTSYNGNFGFSWFRKGDLAAYGVTPSTIYSRTNQVVNINNPCNDQAFDTIMGRHYNVVAGTSPPPVRVVVQNGNDSSHFFDLDAQMASNHKLDFRKLLIWGMSGTDEYLVPVMTLCKGKEAVLRLFIEAKKEVSKLEFEFDNPLAISQGYLTITPSKIENIQAMPYGKSIHIIKVKCLKEFSKELIIRVKAYTIKNAGGILLPMSDICGAVRLLPNDISRQRQLKIVFFNVRTLLNSSPNLGLTGTGTSEIDTLKKLLGQAYVIPDITVVSLDLTTETDHRYTGSYYSVPNYVIGKSISGNSNVFDPNKKRDLEDFLVDKISNPPFNIYKVYYKIFFFGDFCTYSSGGGLGGFSSARREKFTVIFSGATPDSPTHELGHSLGLPHTFDGSTSRAKYVYQDGTTDNIMDYSHLIGVKKSSFFHWQWSAINNNLP